MTSPYSPPLFTVVIPCYRCVATITAAIESVLAQTERDFELIVVDDACPDNSGAYAKAAIGADPRGRVVRQANAGPAAARNHGARLGHGLMIAFLDADDRWTPDTLAHHRDHFDATDQLGISFGRVRFYDQTLTTPGRLSAYVPSLGLAESLAENPTCTASNLVVRSYLFSALKGFEESLSHAEDQDFILRTLATTSYRVQGLDAELVHYRMSPRGLSADLEAMERGWRQMVQRSQSYIDPGQFAVAEPNARALFSRYLARRALRTGYPARVALHYFWSALRARPSALFAAETKRTCMTAAGLLAALSLPRWASQSLIAR